MPDKLRIAIAQLNPLVGDIAGNVALVLKAREEAARMGADLVVASELVVSGYPPEDLVLKPAFQDRIEAAIDELAKATDDGGPGLLVGAPWRQEERLRNAALLLDGGKLVASRLKHHLPNYGVFDELRVFESGPLPGPMDFRGVRLGVMVCEDMWFEDVGECLGESGAEILVCLNGSPFEQDKPDERINLAVARVTETGLPLIYVNQVGGQDELVFDGASFVIDSACKLALQAPAFGAYLGVTEWRREKDGWGCADAEIEKPPEGLEAIYRAMTLGLHDYVEKNGFPGIILGMSGGIDSALSAAVAVDALGADRVHLVMMPSPYTSDDSLEDAGEAAGLLGARLDEVAIEPAMAAFEGMLRPLFDGRKADTTEENIQARTRGITLMAISNKFGYMVLSTGNKSEMSVGYATLYGDMCGGYSVLKDVYKTDVFALSKWRNQARPDTARGPAGRVIPERIITKPPSAELKPDQTDQDTLPPYDELDDILKCLIERESSVTEIVARGHEEAVVQKIWYMLDVAEYKRRQAPPGVKLTRKSFGRERRYPITNAFKSLI
ncbi:MAG: NAD+ synthase [Alphaproteobacteria bacterium]